MSGAVIITDAPVDVSSTSRLRLDPRAPVAQMRWTQSHRADPIARVIADRHYNRQKVGSPQFVPPGRCFVLLAGEADSKALWVTSFPYAQFVKHRWAGAWVNSLFRNEGAGLSSELILEAVAATRWYYGDAPAPHGLVSFVNASKVRAKRDPGRCYLRAGFESDGETESGLLAFVLRPARMPPPVAPRGATKPYVFPPNKPNQPNPEGA